MRISLILFTVLAFVLGSVSSCKKCKVRVGKQTEKIETTGSFNEIDIEGKFDILLCQNGKNQVKLRGAEKILENITVEHSGQKLTIRNINTCSSIKNYQDKVVLIIEFDSIKNARFSVPGNIQNCDTLQLDQFFVKIDNCNLDGQLNLNASNAEFTFEGGTSTFTVSGKSEHTVISDNGNSHILMQDLISKALVINSIGTGKITSTATDYIRASVAGSVYVEYYGQPKTALIDEQSNSAKVVAK